MDNITIEAEVGRDHRLVDALPLEVPVGRVKLVIEPVPSETPSTSEGDPDLSHTSPARESARAKLLAAGMLGTAHIAPKDAARVSDEELQRIGKLPPGSPTLLDLINEDRGPY